MAPVLTRDTKIFSSVAVICRPSCSFSQEDHNNSHARWSTCCFPLSFSITYAGTSSAIRPTTVCSVLLHRLTSFQFAPLYEGYYYSRHTKTLSPGRSSTAPALRSYRHLCLAASWFDDMRAALKAFLKRPCKALMYSCTPLVFGNCCDVENKRSIGRRGLLPIIKKYGE